MFSVWCADDNWKTFRRLFFCYCIPPFSFYRSELLFSDQFGLLCQPMFQWTQSCDLSLLDHCSWLTEVILLHSSFLQTNRDKFFRIFSCSFCTLCKIRLEFLHFVHTPNTFTHKLSLVSETLITYRSIWFYAVHAFTWTGKIIIPFSRILFLRTFFVYIPAVAGLSGLIRQSFFRFSCFPKKSEIS
jgi:hypothetical protein